MLGKPSVWDFFAKIVIAVFINSTTLELTFETDCVFHFRDMQPFVRTLELEELRSKGVAMHAHAAYDECTYINCGRGLSI